MSNPPNTGRAIAEMIQVKVSQAAETEMDSWRQGTRDDLVLSIAVAAWLGEHAMHRLVIGLFEPSMGWQRSVVPFPPFRGWRA
jgi:hypothetical protein